MRGGKLFLLVSILALALSSCGLVEVQEYESPSEFNKIHAIDYPYDEPDRRERRALDEAFTNENKALALYRKVLDTFPGEEPFERVLFYDELHVAALEEIYIKYELSMPEANFYPNATDFEILEEACKAAQTFSENSIDLYDDLLFKTDNMDITTVFNQIRSDYYRNFEPSFRRCFD